MKFYYDSGRQAWVVGNQMRAIPGTIKLLINNDRLHFYDVATNTEVYAPGWVVTEIEKNAAGDKYATIADFDTATSGFFVKASGGSGGVSLPITQSDVTGLTTALSNKIETSKMGAASGVAATDANNLLETKHLPSSIINGLKWQGVWNVATSTPTIPAAATGNAGYFYKVSVAGTSSITGTSTAFSIGDWLISKGTAWERVPSYESVGSVNTKTGAVVLSAADVSAFALSSILAKGDVLVGKGSGQVSRVPAGANGQVLGYDDSQETGIKPMSVAAATGVEASYLRATGTGEQTMSSAGTLVQFPSVTGSQGSDITFASNCFLLKANRTYNLEGSIGGLSFTTTGNSYFYAQWRTGQTGGSGTLLGLPANVEASANSTTANKTVPVARAYSYTPTTDTWVHLECTNVGTVCNIGCNVRANAWIQVIAGAAPITGQSVDYLFARNNTVQPISTASNQVVVLNTTIAGNMTLSGNAITLRAGKTYELEGSIGSINGTDAFATFQFKDTTNNVMIGTIGSRMSPTSTIANSNSTQNAKCVITPTTNITVQLIILTNTIASTIGQADFVDYPHVIVKQLGTSSVADMVGATLTTDGVGGTIPKPVAGKHRAVLLGNGTWDNKEWIAFTPIIKAVTTNPTLGTGAYFKCHYMIDGKNLKIRFLLVGTTPGSNIGSGNYKIDISSIPVTIDTSQLVADGSGYADSQVGIGSMTNGSTAYNGMVKINVLSATELGAWVHQAWNGTGAANWWSSTNHAIVVKFSFQADIPIV